MAEKEKKKKKDESILVEAAEAIGKAAGKVAALVGAEKPNTPPQKVKIPKLAKSGKSRLPRKVKKARQKADAVASKRK